MLALYLEKIKEYKPLFEENGVSLKTGLMWSCFRMTLPGSKERLSKTGTSAMYTVPF